MPRAKEQAKGRVIINTGHREWLEKEKEWQVVIIVII